MNRFTVIDALYHQTEGGEPVAVSNPFGRMLSGDEQAYRRLMKFGKASVPLDFGWVGEAGCGMIYLLNSGRNTVYVYCQHVAVFKIRPGESCRFEPWQTAGWTVSGESVVDAGGACRLDVFALPL